MIGEKLSRSSSISFRSSTSNLHTPTGTPPTRHTINLAYCAEDYNNEEQAFTGGVLLIIRKVVAHIAFDAASALLRCTSHVSILLAGMYNLP